MKVADAVKSPVAWVSLFKHQMAAAGRVLAYSSMEPEPGYDRGQHPDDWPRLGALSLIGPDCQPKFTCNVLAGTKVGIVGQSKTEGSFLLEEFCRMKRAKLKILIDGLSIDHLNIQSARTAVALIPSSPFLFGGSLRLNLDPGDEYDDGQLWHVLEKVQLKSLLEARALRKAQELLYTSVATDGLNLNAPERQLLYLARVLLRQSKIVLYQEAAVSSYEEHTAKELVERVIMDTLRDRTVLYFVRRVDTVLDHDTVLVVDDGQIVENGAPCTLRQTENSRFAHLLEQYRFS